MEDKYYCSLCTKNYKSSQSFSNHNKKFHDDIVKVKQYKCKYCNKSFDSRYNKCYHQKKCTNKKEEVSINKQITTVNDSSQIINSTSNSHNNINNNTINSNNKTIIINNYANDNIEYISEKFKERLFKNLLDEDEHSIPVPKLLENINFNPNHKENHNIKIKSDRSKIGFYYDQKKWKAMNKNELLEELCNKGLKLFFSYFEEMKESFTDDMRIQFEQFFHVAKIKSDLRKHIKEKIENTAYIFTINNEENDLDK